MRRPARDLTIGTVGVLCLLLIGRPATAGAGQGGDLAVSRELMNMVLRGPGVALGDTFDLRNAAPADFPSELLPPGSKVGAAGVAASATVVVAIAPDAPEAVRLNETKRISELGWTIASPVRGGLVAAPAGTPIVFCRRTDFAYVGFVARAEGGSYVRIGVTKEPGRSCAAVPSVTLSTAANVPSMVPPPGARSFGGGGGGSNDSWYSSMRLETTQSPSDVEAHYLKQLTAAGWKIVGKRLAGSDTSLVRFSFETPDGQALTGMLTVTSFPNTRALDVNVRVIRDLPARTPPPMNLPPMNPPPAVK